MITKKLLLILTSISISATSFALDFQREAVQIAKGFRFTEGPMYSKSENALLFSDIPASIIYKVDKNNKASVFLDNTDSSNGLSLDLEGNIIACQKRSICKIDKDKKITVFMTEFEGKKLNAPNDIVVKSDGSIYFTDPNYGLKKDAQEIRHLGIYRISKDLKEITLLDKSLKKPNGLAFSPDEKILYINDHGAGKIYAFNLKEDGSLSKATLFAESLKSPDGIKVHKNGNLFVATKAGIVVLDNTGKVLGTIKLGDIATNCAFDDTFEKLYITTRKSIYLYEL